MRILRRYCFGVLVGGVFLFFLLFFGYWRIQGLRCFAISWRIFDGEMI